MGRTLLVVLGGASLLLLVGIIGLGLICAAKQMLVG